MTRKDPIAPVASAEPVEVPSPEVWTVDADGLPVLDMDATLANMADAEAPEADAEAPEADAEAPEADAEAPEAPEADAEAPDADADRKAGAEADAAILATADPAILASFRPGPEGWPVAVRVGSDAAGRVGVMLQRSGASVAPDAALYTTLDGAGLYGTADRAQATADRDHRKADRGGCRVAYSVVLIGGTGPDSPRKADRAGTPRVMAVCDGHGRAILTATADAATLATADL